MIGEFSVPQTRSFLAHSLLMADLRGPYYYDSFVTEEAVAGRFRDLLSVTQRTSSTAETSEMCPADPPFPALSWTPYAIWAHSKIINFCFLLASSSVPPTATD